MSFFVYGLSVLGLVVGMVIGYFVRKTIAKNIVNSSEAKARDILNDAHAKQKDLLLQAKEKSIKVIEEAKHEEEARRKELSHQQERLEKRESLFDQKILDLESKQQRLQDEIQKIEKGKEEIQKIKLDQIAKLERIANLTQDEGKKILLDHIERIAAEDLVARIRKLDEQGSVKIEERIKEAVTTAMQRYAASQAQEITTTIVSIPSDEMKGRIIGKEGRNIKTIEHITGTEIIVDETPEVITVSGFSPIRRHVAKRAIEKLVADGRIHPARIEDAIQESKEEIALEIKKAGEDALYELSVTGVDPKLVQILGRLKFRTSYGQSQLQHSLEVGHIAGLLAAELGSDVAAAKKAGLFHDIGKAVDHEIEGSHPQLGYTILKKFNFPEEIAYQAIGHHEDKVKTLLQAIVKAADAISGSRPGARKDSYEQYVKRLEELEKIAMGFEGVNKAYAIQAGREIRVFVTPEQVDDLKSEQLARDMARKIEADLQYPGEIRVTLIREKRVVEYAR